MTVMTIRRPGPRLCGGGFEFDKLRHVLLCLRWMNASVRRTGARLSALGSAANPFRQGKRGERQ